MIQASVFLSSFAVVYLLIKGKIDSFWLFIHSASCNTQEKNEKKEKKRRLIILSVSLALPLSCCCCKMDWFEIQHAISVIEKRIDYWEIDVYDSFTC